ncbi:MAG: quercetin 2,3-dioxygenase [Actinomycetota bacterium]|nr:quercetin 2,3-dioxygenase [Actinomycetota bacterium]
MTDGTTGTTLVKRSGERFFTDLGWLDSKHSFSFGHHYDARNTHFGLLLVSNDDVVAPGTGFETHPHRDMEIVTWVLDGGLVHQDSIGHNGVIYPGLAQRMSAGTGILHSEKNDLPTSVLTSDPAAVKPVHFVQMWVVPDESRIEPGYEQLDIGDQLARGGLVTVASGMGRHRDEAAIRIRQKDAALFAARLADAETVQLPTAPYVHLYVARGEVDLEGAGRLGTGDAARITGSAGQRVTALGDAEVLVWEMHADVARP